MRDLPAKHFRQIALKIFDLLKNPNPADSKSLTGYPYMRADSGEYRIIYRVESDTLKVILVGKRNDSEVYRQLGKL